MDGAGRIPRWPLPARIRHGRQSGEHLRRLWRMNVVLDANVLLRLADPTSSAHAIAATAILALRLHGHTLYVVPQCIYEFWAVATRPIANNGLGLSVTECIE